MNNSTTKSPLAPPIKPFRAADPNSGQGTGTGAGEKEPQSAYGARIAQTALDSVGMSTRDFGGPFIGPPEYAAAMSILFTRATNQDIILGTEPRHVLSTSLLCNSLLHDRRFKQVPMSEAAPGDIAIESSGNQAHGYAGIVVDHGRIVSNSGQGVQNNCSLAEIQRGRRDMVIFRYVGVQRHRGYPLANAGFNPEEPRIPAGGPGGGQWTTGAAGTKASPGVYGPIRKSGLCAGEQITPEGEETEPVLREKNELEERLENFRELTPQEKAVQDAETEFKAQLADDAKFEKLKQEKDAKRGIPQWLRDLFRKGNQFNEEREPFYRHNEVWVENKQNPNGSNLRLDSYEPGKEIVFRRFTQLGRILQDTFKKYLDEFETKYSPGTKINAGPLAGQKLEGAMIFEVPPQEQKVPEEFQKLATQRKIILRDIDGNILNPPIEHSTRQAQATKQQQPKTAEH